MVALVIVSHSARLAEGVAELAHEMGGGEVAVAPAGGIEEEGTLGTDAERVRAAIERVRTPDGVLVLMDLGSALMSAEMATEMLDPPGDDRVLLCAAPLVEGAVAAAAAARGGATLREVADEARGALTAKQAQLGEQEEPEPAAPAADAAAGEDGAWLERRLPVPNRLGLHARPAARFVEAAGRFDARLSVANATTGRGPASARSLTGLSMLDVRQGQEILVRASGDEAAAALDALAELAAAGFGDEDGAVPAAAASAPTAEPAPAAPAAQGAVAPPAPGAELRGIAASAGSAAGPARHIEPPPLALPDEPP
ncbi:MAG TPA: dihydroxyacetone kinase phosphoryl donor subunit DhaM, partial [Solirubrobacteraceae bacterium]|nr:dihydroxyacetone kinase phosphoryl donor subunit DhaM [Solirubrobacteraceae bacterium]